MSNLVTNKKRGRTLKMTIDELLQSKRLELAIHNFKRDPQQLRAILIELNTESWRVAKTALVKVYNTHSSLQQFELSPLLRGVDADSFNTYNIYWSLTPLERKLYEADPKLQLSKEEYDKLFEKFKAQYE